MKNKKPLYIFLHVPKCAGTTIKDHFKKNLKKDAVLTLYGYKYPYTKKRKNVEKYIKSLTEEKRNKIELIFGHRTYYGLHQFFPDREIRYITFLRNPVKRTISHYEWNRMCYCKKNIERGWEMFPKGKRDLLFESWFDNWEKREDQRRENLKISNFMFRFLFNHLFKTPLKEKDVNYANLKKIKDTLNKFYFIGITKNPGDFLFIYDMIGVTKFFHNANVSKDYLTQKEIMELKKSLPIKLEFDRELYEYALELNKKFKEKHKNYYFIVIHMFLKKVFYYTHLKLLELCKLSLLRFYKLSAKLKKRSKLYIKLVKLIKDVTGIK